jgi:hypothetical protein
MRKINPELDTVLTNLGANEAVKAMLLGFLENQSSSVQGQIVGLRANALNATSQADALEPEAARLSGMLAALTVEVPDEAVPAPDA